MRIRKIALEELMALLLDRGRAGDVEHAWSSQKEGYVVLDDEILITTDPIPEDLCQALNIFGERRSDRRAGSGRPAA